MLIYYYAGMRLVIAKQNGFIKKEFKVMSECNFSTVNSLVFISGVVSGERVRVVVVEVVAGRCVL